jgi:hypothetical protein
MRGLGARFGPVCTLFAVAACPGGGSVDAGPPNDDGVELGSGTLAWLPLAEDAELDLIAGPQGGHHFIVHARIRDMIPGDPSRPGLLANPITRFSVWLDDGGTERQIDLMFPPYRLGYEEMSDGWFSLASGRILQVAESELPALYGQRVRIGLEVTDAAGVHGRDSRTVVAIEERAGADDAGAVDGNPADAGTIDGGM